MAETIGIIVAAIVGLALIVWRAAIGRMRPGPPPIPPEVRKAAEGAVRANIEAAAAITEARTEEKTVKTRIAEDLAIKDEAERLRRLADGLKDRGR